MSQFCVNVKCKSSFKCPLLLVFKCPLFPAFHFLLLALFLQRCAAFLNSHVSFLFVCSALWWLYYYCCCECWNAGGTEKTSAPQRQRHEQQAGLGVQYADWHLHFKRGRWNKPLHFYAIWHPRLSCSTISSFTLSFSFCISLCQSTSFFLHS